MTFLSSLNTANKAGIATVFVTGALTTGAIVGAVVLGSTVATVALSITAAVAGILFLLSMINLIFNQSQLKDAEAIWFFKELPGPFVDLFMTILVKSSK